MKYLVYTTARPPGLLQKTVALVTTAGLIGLVLMFAAVLLPFVLAIIAAAWAWLWWKTRELRRQMKQMRNFSPPGTNEGRAAFREEVFTGEIIEGEATRVDGPGDRFGR